MKTYTLLAFLLLTAAFAWPGPRQHIPKDFRDAPSSAALEELSGGADPASAPEIAPQPAAAPAQPAARKGTGKWTGWLQGRSDYGYLPGTQNVNSGASGFKVYYRCSSFRREPDGGFSMRMQFGNDKGGDLGIVTWTRGPSAENSLTVKFEGTARFYDAAGRAYQPKNPASVLNAMDGYSGFCSNAYRSLEVHRPAIVKYLMKKDLKSMERLYSAAKFIPGPIGLYAEGMEITIALSQQEGFKAAEGAGCLITGLVLEKATHRLVKKEVLKYLIEKSCSGAATAIGALHHGEKHEGPLYFTGVVKETRAATDYLGRRTLYPDPAAARVELAYLETEETVKNIFFDNWR